MGFRAGAAITIAILGIFPATSALAQVCTPVGNTTTCEGTAGTPGTGQSGGDVVAPSLNGPEDPDQRYRHVGGAGGSAAGAGAGGDGGDATGAPVLSVTLAAPTPGDTFSYVAQGGRGGDATSGSGGDGGDGAPSIDATITGNGWDVSIFSTGGDGGTTTGGPRGDGGDGGDVEVVVDGTFGGMVTASSMGGDVNGPGTGGLGGDAGEVTLEINGKVGGVIVQSVAGAHPGLGTGRGQGGDITVIVKGEIESNFFIQPGAANVGDVLVRLEDGAKVGATINNNGQTHGQLEFAMHVGSQAELDAATASINAAMAGGVNGTVTVGNEAYSFTGFSTLRNLISVLAAQNPGQPITVTIASSETGTTQPGSSFVTKTASVVPGSAAPYCDNRRAIPRLDADGRVRLTVRLPGEQRRFTVGWVDGSRFVRAVEGWSAEIAPEGDVLKVKLIGPEGGVFATCFVSAAG
jgi:hypothetical protein